MLVLSTASGSPNPLECSDCVQKRTDNEFSLGRKFVQHATVGIEVLRYTGGAGETTTAAWD